MSFNVGINVVEVDGRATPSIQAAPTSQTGFVVRSARGLPGSVRRITSFAQYTQHFGGYLADAVGAYALRGFFDNGGSVAYVTRAVSDAGTTAAVASRGTITTGADDALTVTAGFRGRPDVGAWGDGLAVRGAANARGSSTGAPGGRRGGRGGGRREQL